ncbi:MAG: VCBS repeat-containing protein [Isosphaeraceae bacterium]|nr:VCBS repeat-containing protein [Isosphaeraceae bacterium]
MHGRWFCRPAALGVLLACATASRADEPRLAEYFGFLPVEIYKLDTRIAGLLLKDLDGDKTNDIAVVNNGRSRIDLLLSSKKAESPDAGAEKPEINEVPNDRRMRLVSVPVNKEVVSLQAGDFNGDGKPDLAFYGTPAEITVLYNEGNGRFGSPLRINSGEAIESGTALAVGDLDRDGRDDLALLCANELVLVYQKTKGKLSEPERLPHTAANPRMLRAADMDGDGADDLVTLDGSDTDPIHIRFATEGGRLGPEQRFQVETPRAIAFGNMDGKKGTELLTIENQSGRAKVFTLDEADEDEGGKRGRLIFYPLPHGGERGRSLDVGDLDGDGRVDVVVTDPANAQFLVYRQGAKSGLGAGQNFPGLVGGKTVKLADLDGDRKDEVYVLSEQEKQIGRSLLQGGRLSFPTPLPVSGEPVALDVGDLDGDKVPEVLYVSRTRANGAEAFSLRAVKREKSGTFVPFRWGPEDDVSLKGLTGVPPALRILDVNRDGHADVLVFNPFGPPTLLLGRAGEPPAPAAGSLGPLGGVTPAGLSVVDLNGPAILVAQNTFARSLVLDKDGHWEVKDQYNTERSSSQVVGASALDTNGDGVKDVVLLDKNSKSLIFLELKDGVYRPGGTLSVGPLDFQGMHVADFDGDGRDDLLLAGTDRFGIVLTGRKGQRLKTLASYESDRTEAKLGDLAAGDLNADGRPDVAITDVGDHFMEIVTYAGQANLERGLVFKVFERKSYRGGRDSIEPRDLGIADVDGDGREDLVLIVHDRVLVYRQDAGKSEEPAKGK